jgi:putative ABC transport system ATP-binding protein
VNLQAALVTVRDASVRYTDETEVRLPDLELRPGEEVALVGPSGSGKTTLLHVLAGLVRVSNGELRVGDLDLRAAGLSALETYRARTVGLMFQDFHLLDGFTALEQVTVALGLAGVPIPEATRRARALLERVSLGHRLHATPRKLSTGERQRVALARALATKPKLLLVDEPTAHLDAKRAQVALELLRELTREVNAALLIATHDPAVIAALPRWVNVSGLEPATLGPSTPESPTLEPSTLEKREVQA